MSDNESDLSIPSAFAPISVSSPTPVTMTTSTDKKLTFSSGRSYDLRADPDTDFASSVVLLSSEERVKLASKDRCKIENLAD
jgi:hypothetical protein